MPGRFVVHLHATWVNQFSCCREGRSLVLDNLGDDVIWIDLVDPGFALAQALQEELRAFTGRTGKDCPRAVIMQNHGLVVSGATRQETTAHIEWLSSELRAVHDQAAKEHADKEHADKEHADKEHADKEHAQGTGRRGRFLTRAPSTRPRCEPLSMSSGRPCAACSAGPVSP